MTSKNGYSEEELEQIMDKKESSIDEIIKEESLKSNQSGESEEKVSKATK